GELSGSSYEELVYEGYAPGGVAVLVEVLTDNKNRAAANVRNLFSRNGGNLGSAGSVSYMFNRKGVIEYDSEQVDEEALMELALEAGAEDIQNAGGVLTVTTVPGTFETVLESLQAKGWESLSAGISMVPDTYLALDEETARKVLKMIDRLEEEEDVQAVYSNADIPSELVL
ncbi:YebC/PmpR family DNA-binding transcriptional regulator, partial [Treponema pallidum]